MTETTTLMEQLKLQLLVTADKAVAGGKTVTPDAPNATDADIQNLGNAAVWMKMAINSRCINNCLH
ncbi:MAG: hypothetical protein ACLS5G_00460 [Streptococcus sp.]